MCIVRPIPAATAPLVGTLLFLALCVAAVPGRAGNVNYAFNSSDGGWTVQSTGTFPNPGSQWEWTPPAE